MSVNLITNILFTSIFLLAAGFLIGMQIESKTHELEKMKKLKKCSICIYKCTTIENCDFKYIGSKQEIMNLIRGVKK